LQIEREGDLYENDNDGENDGLEWEPEKEISGQIISFLFDKHLLFGERLMKSSIDYFWSINNGEINLAKVLYWIVLGRYFDLNNKRDNLELHLKPIHLLLRVK
jgi:hypothetical protein